MILYFKHNMFILRDTEVVNMHDICFMKESHTMPSEDITGEQRSTFIS